MYHMSLKKNEKREVIFNSRPVYLFKAIAQWFLYKSSFLRATCRIPRGITNRVWDCWIFLLALVIIPIWATVRGPNRLTSCECLYLRSTEHTDSARVYDPSIRIALVWSVKCTHTFKKHYWGSTQSGPFSPCHPGFVCFVECLSWIGQLRIWLRPREEDNREPEGGIRRMYTWLTPLGWVNGIVTQFLCTQFSAIFTSPPTFVLCHLYGSEIRQHQRHSFGIVILDHFHIRELCVLDNWHHHPTSSTIRIWLHNYVVPPPSSDSTHRATPNHHFYHSHARINNGE